MRSSLVLRRSNRRNPRNVTLGTLRRSLPKANEQGLSKSVKEAAKKALEGRPYYDPANSTLDFSKPNKTLISEIRNESINRNRLRIKDPASAWVLAHGSLKQVNAIKNEAKIAITGATYSMRSSLKPLSVGDIVLLSKDSTLLHLVVGAPNTLASNVYTFINHEGEVTFGTKHHVQLRIPGVLSHDKTASMNLVALEQKHAGLAPIGVPDSAFSRQNDRSDMAMKRAAKASQKTPESFLLPREPASASLESGPRDFTVAQASSQLLTDTNVNTYIVPTSAREIYLEHFTKISTGAFLRMTEFGNRLDYFHKVLQYDDAGCLIQSSRTIPLFELFRIVSMHEVPLSEEGPDRLDKDRYKVVSKQIRKHAPSTSEALGLLLPRGTDHGFSKRSFLASSYIAFIGALSRSGRKWKINVQPSTKTPISVDVIPLSRSNDLESALDYLKNGGIEEISLCVMEKIEKGHMTSVPSQFGSVIQMLKDFVSGNMNKDRSMESLLASLVRSIDSRLISAGLAKQSEMQFSHEFARLRAYEILVSLEEGGIRNPLQWNSALALPGTKTSRDSDRFLQFYEFLDSQLESKAELYNDSCNVSAEDNKNNDISGLESEVFSKYLKDEFYQEDPMVEARENFGQTPVYCIDSETAHEIDDGISIEDNGKSLAITVHIANPTSYIKPDSSLSQIAYEKGTTIYLPEGPTMMLPGVVSKMCGLNGKQNTRTLGIRFLLEKAHVKAYHEQLQQDPSARPLADLGKKMKDAIEKSATIKFYTVSNFPKGFTYKKVNEILNDAENIKKFRNDDLAEGSHERNLFNLHMVADLIKHFRVTMGSGFGFNTESSKVTVNYADKEISPDTLFAEVENGWQIALLKKNGKNTPVITISREVNQNLESKSQHLVSNLMIAANFAGSMFARNEGFPIIFRHQELEVKDSVWKEIRKLEKLNYYEHRELQPDEKSQLLSIATAASFLTFPLRHHMLGLPLYLNLTSPLRRYVDMINHWKFQDYTLLKLHEKEENGNQSETSLPKSGQNLEFGMRKSDMDYVACHLQGCELRNKQAQRFSDSFWMAQFLRRYFEMEKLGQIKNPITFLFLLGSDAKHGDVRAELIGFSSLQTTVLQNTYIKEKFAKEEWEVGQVLTNPKFRVVKLDFIEGEFTIELLLPKESE